MAAESYIFAQLYNPAKHRISSYTVRILAEPAGEFKGFDRVYEGSVSLGPFSDEGAQIEARLPERPEGSGYTGTLEKATRR